MVKSFVWSIANVIVGGVFIFAGLTKVFDLDHLLADMRHLRLNDFLVDLQHVRLANPMSFANDIDNYKILPWIVGVGLAFYLPWLEMFCGLALILRRLYLGGLSILTALVSVFLLATVAARVRGLDITCGCFGHASQNWSFPAHMATDLGILAALLALCFQAALGRKSSH
jgi:putative oxidoreductase